MFGSAAPIERRNAVFSSVLSSDHPGPIALLETQRLGGDLVCATPSSLHTREALETAPFLWTVFFAVRRVRSPLEHVMEHTREFGGPAGAPPLVCMAFVTETRNASTAPPRSCSLSMSVPSGSVRGVGEHPPQAFADGFALGIAFAVEFGFVLGLEAMVVTQPTARLSISARICAGVRVAVTLPSR